MKLSLWRVASLVTLGNPRLVVVVIIVACLGGGILLSDDGGREGERAIVERWKQELPDVGVRFIDDEKGTYLIEMGKCLPTEVL